MNPLAHSASSSEPTLSDAAALEALSRGQIGALGLLYDRYSSAVYDFVRRASSAENLHDVARRGHRSLVRSKRASGRRLMGSKDPPRNPRMCVIHSDYFAEYPSAHRRLLSAGVAPRGSTHTLDGKKPPILGTRMHRWYARGHRRPRLFLRRAMVATARRRNVARRHQSRIERRTRLRKTKRTQKEAGQQNWTFHSDLLSVSRPAVLLTSL